MSEAWDAALRGADEHEFCYLTTTGRRSGRGHRIEIWFVVHGGAVWLLTEPARAPDWVRNLRAEPSATLEVGAWSLSVTGEEVADYPTEGPARGLLAARYRHSDPDLQRWAAGARVVRLVESDGGSGAGPVGPAEPP